LPVDIESGDDGIPREDWVMLITIHGGALGGVGVGFREWL
jgi:hypothetical protein